MRKLTVVTFLLLTIFAAIAFVGCAGYSESKSRTWRDMVPGYGYYKADPYIRDAIALQSLGRTAAVARLHQMAHDIVPNYEELTDARALQNPKIIILCRMLFVPRPNSEFRRPRLGEASFFGGTDYPDWPLEPIELVDGVPFLVTRAYAIAGEPEQGESYLRYCETNCDWSDFRYAIKTRQEMKEALTKLFTSSKWKRPLDASERDFLQEQIQ